MTFESMKQNADQVAQGMDRIADILQGEHGLAPVAEYLKDRAARLRQNRFTLMVVGEFKRGKSTLINALLGQKLVPQKATPCTAIITHIRYGEQPAALIVYADGKPMKSLSLDEFNKEYELDVRDVLGLTSGTPDERSLDEFETRLMQQVTDRWGSIDHAEICHPLELCRNGVELVDSPGLAEHPARDKRVLEYLRNADAVVMVLDALALLNARERRFLQEKLIPLDLHRRAFYVINRWNQVLAGLIDPNDPEEVEKNVREKREEIDLKLKPLCQFDGGDHSTSRIFCVNALAALQQRIAKAPASSAALQESKIPAFEESLKRFLREDRFKARQATDRAVMQEAQTTLATYGEVQQEKLDQPLQKLEEEYAKLQPQLEKLRNVARHIETCLTARASVAAEELCRSFDTYSETHITKPLPDFIDKLNLGPAESVFVGLRGFTDLFRPENKKLKADLENHLQPQIARFFRPRLTRWAESVKATSVPKLVQETEAELGKEAREYVDVLKEIDKIMGTHTGDLSAEALLKKWAADFPIGSPDMGLMNVTIDLGPLLATLAVDALAHTLNILPGIGFLTSMGLMLWRRKKIKDDLKGQIEKELALQWGSLRTQQQEALRSGLREGFGKLQQTIQGKIDAQIAVIDASLRGIIDEKKKHNFSADKERQRLKELEEKTGVEIRQIEALLQA